MTLFKFITMLSRTSHIIWNIPHIQIEYEKYSGIFCKILLVPQNNVMDLYNVKGGRVLGKCNFKLG